MAGQQLDRWRDLHARASHAYEEAVSAVVDPAAGTPAGRWTFADGAFAPPVDVPDSASHVQRLVAPCGRDPSWSDGPA